MHIPKSAGASVHAALERALSPEAVSPRRQDASLFSCGFTDVHLLDPGTRAVVVADRDEINELRDFEVVIGHFPLATLLSVTPAHFIATVIREARSRVLSHYAFWRASSPALAAWHPYPAFAHARRPLEEFLGEPSIARATDNVVCRMLLAEDPLIPELDFIDRADVEAVAGHAIDAIGTLGYVGVLEFGDSVWDGLSQFFGVPLSEVRLNTTAAHSEAGDGPAADLAITADALELLEARTAADAIVYRHVLGAAGCSGEDAERLQAAAFASELARFGDVAGTFAAKFRAQVRHERDQLEDQRRLLSDAQRDLAETRDQLRSYEIWLDQMERSPSWRLTAPLRAAKHAVRTLPARVSGPRGNSRG
jgi:hypothetical protein